MHVQLAIFLQICVRFLLSSCKFNSMASPKRVSTSLRAILGMLRCVELIGIDRKVKNIILNQNDAILFKIELFADIISYRKFRR